MATATDSVGSTVEPHRCDNAAEFVLRRLDESDEPRSPSGLASEYGCGNNWMRQAMSKLESDGEIERISRGSYVARDDPDDGTDVNLSVLSGANTDAELEPAEKQDEGTDADEGESVGSDNADEGDRTETQAATTNATAFFEGVDPRTLMLVVGVAAVVYVAYRSLSGSESSADQGGSDGDGEQVEQAVDVEGGLLG